MENAPREDMGEEEIWQYVSHLASDLRVSSSTQNQALWALVFLYEQVIETEPGDFGRMARTRCVCATAMKPVCRGLCERLSGLPG
jgi:hypothetical protein